MDDESFGRNVSPVPRKQVLCFSLFIALTFFSKQIVLTRVIWCHTHLFQSPSATFTLLQGPAV